MAKLKTDEADKNTVPIESATFGFFRDEIADVETGVRVFEASSMKDPDGNSSGSYMLDYDLVVPFPEGRIIEVFGGEGTGKSTLCLEVIGRALASNPEKKACIVNMEKSLNMSLMRTVRSLCPFLDEALANTKKDKKDCRLWIVNANTGEQALEAMKRFAEIVPGGIAVLDSIDAAQPEAIMAGAIGQNAVGNHAKLMSDAMRKLVGVAEANRVTLIFVNQIRDKITMYGDPMETPGGKAVRFYATQRIRLKTPTKADMIMAADGQIIGKLINYKIIKNKFSPEGTENAFPILFKNGIFREQELIIQCCNFGILGLGGKGGKQVYLPTIDRKTGEFIKKDGKIDGVWMTQFNAARKLLLDPDLFKKLDAELNITLKNAHNNPVNMLDEVQDSK